MEINTFYGKINDNIKKLVSAIPAGLKCETRNSCFSMEPRQAVILTITSVILLSSQRILSIEGDLLHGVIEYIRLWNARDHWANEVIHCMRSLGTCLSRL